MARSNISKAFLAITALFSINSFAQSDELRNATGLPFSNDQAVIFGQVSFRGLSDGVRPTVHVSLVIGGSVVERMKANENGYFYFLREPRNGSVLIFEVNELEVGRQVLMAGSGMRLRQDIEINWQAIGNAKQAIPGKISAASLYSRSSENEKLFIKAAAGAKAGKQAEAIRLYTQIVNSDSKDFVSWTELGTIHFNNKNFSEADAAYEKALALDPKYLVALMNRGKLYLVRNQLENAIAMFIKASESDPTSADAFHYLGESYLRIKLGSKAVVALNEAIRLSPIEKADLHLRLATLYDAAGAKSMAANEYKLFLEKKPTHPDSEKLRKYIEANLK